MGPLPPHPSMVKGMVHVSNGGGQMIQRKPWY
jgi:hypothetical protein